MDGRMDNTQIAGQVWTSPHRLEFVLRNAKRAQHGVQRAEGGGQTGESGRRAAVVAVARMEVTAATRNLGGALCPSRGGRMHSGWNPGHR